jgi:pimeloyl-ACP methyl ester carboxylesterase
MCEDLCEEGITSLRIRFRNPRELSEGVFDVLAGIEYLLTLNIESLALIGHSLGGAVVIQAAALAPAVRTVVTLATQSFGADVVSRLGPHCSVLLLHGMMDRVLSPACSQQIHQMAREPRRLILYQGAGHSLDEAADDVRQTIRDWITAQLNLAKSFS